MLDFAALPPEINSARMYSGPGSAPMLAAGTAWNHLAAEIRSAADAYSSVISGLTGENWLGPSSASMAAAAAPYAAWMNTTAAQAEQTATQAHAAATAYETALSMTVPPAVITTNRTQLAWLVATNVLGQNTPVIAATEASYGEMWAQDTAAMYGYTNSSSAAAQFTPFSQPAPTTTAAGLAAQSAAATQAAATSAGNSGSTAGSVGVNASVLTWLDNLLNLGNGSDLASLLSGSNNSALGTFLGGNFLSTMVVNGALAGGPFNPQFILQTLSGFSFLQGAGGATEASGTGLLDLFNPGAASSAAVESLGGGMGSGISAAAGSAVSVGGLSAPPSWPAVPPRSPATPTLGATPLAPPEPLPVGPGVVSPLSNMSGRQRRPIPKYGMRLPSFMARPPAAGYAKLKGRSHD